MQSSPHAGRHGEWGEIYSRQKANLADDACAGLVYFI